MDETKLKKLIQDLKSENYGTKLDAIEAIASAQRKGTNISLVIPTLSNLLVHKDEFFVKCTTEALTNFYLKNKEKDKILELMKHKNVIIRRATIFSICVYNDKSSITYIFDSVAEAMFDEDSKVREDAAKTLDFASDSHDISVLIPALVKALGDNSIAYTAKNVIVKAQNKGIDISLAIPFLISNRILGYNCDESILRNFINRKKENAKLFLDEIKKPGEKALSELVIKELVKLVEDILAGKKLCEICRQIPVELSFNVDDPTPEPTGKLVALFSFDANEAGMGGYGIYKCPLCSNYYYNDWEQSMTGSQMNDYEHWSLLRKENAKDFLDLIEKYKVDKNNPEVKKLIQKCEEMKG